VSKNKMSYQDFKTIIDKLPSSVRDITLTGGEPFLLKDELVKMTKYCAETIAKPIVFSSGIVPDEKTIKGIAPNIISIHVTVKYPDSLDVIWKGHAKAHENVIAFLTICKKYNVKTYIHYCVDKNNSEYLSEMVEFGKKYSVAGIHVLRFLAFDKKDVDIVYNDAEWKLFCKRCDEYKDQVELKAPSCEECLAGCTRMNILTNGNVTGCIYLPGPAVGNIIKDSYKNIEKKLEVWRTPYGPDSACIARIEYDEAFSNE